MFAVKKTEPSAFDLEIVKLQNKLAAIDPLDGAYKTVVDHLQTVHKLRETELSRKHVSRDKAADVIGSLLGIVAIAAYEQRHIFTTKALGFVIKPK